MDKQDNRMNRRDFLKIVGISTAGTAVALSGKNQPRLLPKVLCQPAK